MSATNQQPTNPNPRAHLKPWQWTVPLIIAAALTAGYFAYQNYAMQKTASEIRPSATGENQNTEEYAVDLTETQEDIFKLDPIPTIEQENAQSTSKERDYLRLSHLEQLHTALQVYSVGNQKKYPLPAPATWETLMNVELKGILLKPLLPLSTDVSFYADYCYYINKSQSLYVLSTNLETPSREEFQMDINFGGSDFVLVSSQDDKNKTTCAVPIQGKPLKCSDDKVFCLIAGDPNNAQDFSKIILDQAALENARIKARDAKRVSDLKVLHTSLEVELSSSADKKYVKLEGGEWPDLLTALSIGSITPPKSDKFHSDYCYYVNKAQDTIILSTRLEGKKQTVTSSSAKFISPVYFGQEDFFLVSSLPPDKSDCTKPAKGAVLECDKETTMFCLAVGNKDILTRISQ